MNTFNLGDPVRQLSTGGTGVITGIHPVLPPTADRKVYAVRFTSGHPTTRVPPEDLELFVDRRKAVQDRRRPVIVKYQGQCVLESLAKILELPLNEVSTMFDEFVAGQRDPSNLDHVADVLMENGYMICQISKNRAELEGERLFVVLRNDTSAGHTVVVLEDNTIFDPENRFNNSGSDFHAQCLALGWRVENVLLVKNLQRKKARSG